MFYGRIPLHSALPALLISAGLLLCLPVPEASAANSDSESFSLEIDRFERELQAGLAEVAADLAAVGQSPSGQLELLRGEWKARILLLDQRLTRLRVAAHRLDAADLQALRHRLIVLKLRLRNIKRALELGVAPPTTSSATADSAVPAAKGGPVNDACASATVVGNGTFFGDTTAATNDGDATCGSSTGSADIWFRYVAPADGDVNVNTFGSNFDTVLSAHTACPGTTANETACNDSFGTIQSSIGLGFLTSGSEVLLRVSGSFASAGSVTLNVGPASGISGTVTEDGNGDPVTAAVILWNELGFSLDTEGTNGAGAYEFSGLPPGTYFLSTQNFGTLIDELYEDIPCPFGFSCDITSGTPVVATAGSVTSGIDFTLEPGGTLSGTVTDADTGDPLTSVQIEVLDEAGELVSSGSVDVSGAYNTTPGVPTGTYFARTNQFTGMSYVDELYDDIPCPACDPTTGTPIPITAPTETSGIDFALELGGTISGTVTEESTGDPLGNSTVVIQDSQGNFVTSGSADAAGNYTSSGGLPSGTYFAYAFEFGGSNLLNEIYDNIPCSVCMPTIGTPIAVSSPDDTSGIDFDLEEPGSFSGTVTEATTGDPIEFVSIEARDIQGNFLAIGNTAADGTYTVSGLPPGNFLALAFSGYVDELYDDIPCPNGICNLSDGTPISIATNTDTPNIDFDLRQDSFFSGQVTFAGTGIPLGGVVVNVFDDDGHLVASQITGFNGNYFVFGLPAGAYYATTTNTYGFDDELYQGLPCAGGSCDPTTGTPIVTVRDQTTFDVDFTLGNELVIFANGFESGDTSAW